MDYSFRPLDRRSLAVLGSAVLTMYRQRVLLRIAELEKHLAHERDASATRSK